MSDSKEHGRNHYTLVDFISKDACNPLQGDLNPSAMERQNLFLLPLYLGQSSHLA